MEVPSKLLDAVLSMKCCLCQNYLSVPPIMVLSEDGKELKCGRCKNVDTPSITRNFAFENIIEFLSFPCIYKDCDELIPWNEVESHEDICEKKTIKCPFLDPDCEEVVLVQNLKEHMESHHEKYIHYKTCTSSMSSGFYGIDIVISGDQVFLMMIEVVNSLCVIDVVLLNDTSKYFEYDLKLSSFRENTYSVLKENQSVTKYDERKNCFKCIRRTCELIHHPYSKSYNKFPVNDCRKKISLIDMKPLFGDISKIKYNITFHPNKDYEENNGELVDESSDKSTVVENSAELLKEQLQCPECLEYMINGIYNCKKGHVICRQCKIKLKSCPCRKKPRFRNFPLEKLADEVVVACLFSEKGCVFTGKLKSLSHHEKKCEYKKD